jgi:hypothetical protein
VAEAGCTFSGFPCTTQCVRATRNQGYDRVEVTAFILKGWLFTMGFKISVVIADTGAVRGQKPLLRGGSATTAHLSLHSGNEASSASLAALPASGGGNWAS